MVRLVENEQKYWGFIRKLRNDPETQKGFIDQVDITVFEQIAYMADHNDDYWICLDENDLPVGYIGVIKDDIRVAVVSEGRGLGIGKFMVNELMGMKPYSTAKVKLGNTASDNLFKSCGFYHTHSTDEFNFYAKQIS